MQVEVFDSASVPIGDEKKHDLAYLAQMSQDISIAQIPQRIIARYIENFTHIVNNIVNFFEEKNESQILEQK